MSFKNKGFDMNSAPASYGQLIATRYRDCATPLTIDVSGAIPSLSSKSGISQADLAFIASRVSMFLERGYNVQDTYGRLDEGRVPHCQGAVVDDLLAATLAPCPDRRFSVIITHDVDRTTLCECTAIAKIIMGTRARTMRSTISYLGTCRSAIAKTIDELLRFETDNNIRSVFFFLSGPYSLARYGSRNSISWSSAQGIIRAVKAAGMEIGLHGSYYAMDKGSYADERRRLADAALSPIRHHRNHYLRFDPKRFWRQLSDAGIVFDHSVGFTNRWGLRTGTCIPYPVYDYSAQTLSGIIEVPMVIMDGTWAQHFDRAVLDDIRALLGAVRRHRGCVGINFHPEALALATNRAAWEYFRRIVDICRELGADMRIPVDSSLLG